MYVPSSSDPVINLPPGANAPHSGSSSSPVGFERFKRPTKVLPCCSVMTSVARPPRRPSILAIRSLWPTHVPTRNTESAANTGVETRMANVAKYKSAFMWSLLASIHKESHSRCKDGVTNVPARRECTAAEDVSVALMALLRARPASHRRRKPIAKTAPSELGGRLPRRRGPTLRLLGQLRAGYEAGGLRKVHVAPLHTIWRQDRADRIAIVVDHENRVVARDRGDELVVAARRGKRAGETTAVLLVHGHRELDAVEPRLGRWGRSMMRIAGAEDDRLALAFPSAAKVGDRALRRRRDGCQRCEHDDPG